MLSIDRNDTCLSSTGTRHMFVAILLANTLSTICQIATVALTWANTFFSIKISCEMLSTKTQQSYPWELGDGIKNETGNQEMMGPPTAHLTCIFKMLTYQEFNLNITHQVVHLLDHFSLGRKNSHIVERKAYVIKDANTKTLYNYAMLKQQIKSAIAMAVCSLASIISCIIYKKRK